eukprot:TRINITY_DN55913_c0_g1_i1.p1 TRINITY_DN55913_c0_g1~~TRINITY_DN55913_c0_g1_i1.p1  ORF type:complete len:336 (+),score=28.79 TRINITY_DN55913_c0_g1_i1:70-1008(+)
MVIVVMCLLVEKLGGLVGSVLGTVPHVAVVGSVGFIVQTATEQDFEVAMLSMPMGLLCNSLLLLTIRITSWCPLLRRDSFQSWKHLRLPICFVAGLCSYASGVALVMLVFRPKSRSLWTVRLVAIAAFAAQFLIGVLVVLCFSAPAQASQRPRSSWLVLLGRAVVTFCTFFAAVAIAEAVPALAGILANLPIISGAIIIMLWRSQGEELTMACMGPMILGMLSASAYAIISSRLMIVMHPAGGAITSWFASVVSITSSTLFFLQRCGKSVSSDKIINEADRKRTTSPAIDACEAANSPDNQRTADSSSVDSI